jgi:hypothetical protein
VGPVRFGPSAASGPGTGPARHSACGYTVLCRHGFRHVLGDSLEPSGVRVRPEPPLFGEAAQQAGTVESGQAITGSAGPAEKKKAVALPSSVRGHAGPWGDCNCWHEGSRRQWHRKVSRARASHQCILIAQPPPRTPRACYLSFVAIAACRGMRSHCQSWAPTCRHLAWAGTVPRCQPDTSFLQEGPIVCVCVPTAFCRQVPFLIA